MGLYSSPQVLILQALYILRTILQSSAHSSFLGSSVSFKSKETEKKKAIRQLNYCSQK